MTLGPLTDAFASARDEALDAVPRIWARDHTLWREDPTEIADRLGWLDAADRAADEAESLCSVARSVRDDGVTDVLLVGMGGSSLYPQVLAATYGVQPGGARLWVLDSTDPAAVLDVEALLPWETTLVVPASKSGTTIETRCHLERFLACLHDAHGERAGSYVLPITDPGSDLDRRAAADGFRGVVHGQPDVGGRFSALSAFGLLPAALLGLDLDAHVAPARGALEAGRSQDAHVNAAAALGAFLAAGARAGRDKLTLLLPDEIASLGAWIEQLVAESTGKEGRGLLPVLGEHPDNAHFGEDRLVVAVGEQPIERLVDRGVPVFTVASSGIGQLAAEVVRWELATAIAGALMGVHPFDQPDVAAAKDATARVLADGGDVPPVEPSEPLLSTVVPGDYVALLAYVPPSAEPALRDVADGLRARLGVPVTVGIGPRYLHSTGQLHKGGPDTGVFLVVVGDDLRDADIPGRPYGFSRLKRAQAAGDLEALRAAGRRVAHVTLGDLSAS